MLMLNIKFQGIRVRGDLLPLFRCIKLFVGWSLSIMLASELLRLLPGTTIMSNKWKPYTILQNIGFNHLTVNYSINVVDSLTGANTKQ